RLFSKQLNGEILSKQDLDELYALKVALYRLNVDVQAIEEQLKRISDGFANQEGVHPIEKGILSKTKQNFLRLHALGVEHKLDPKQIRAYMDLYEDLSTQCDVTQLVQNSFGKNSTPLYVRTLMQPGQLSSEIANVEVFPNQID